MAVEASIKRIGGSTFARLPAELVRQLGIQDGDTVMLELTKRGKTGPELLELFRSMRKEKLSPMTAEDMDFEGDRWERLEAHARRRRA